MKQLFAFFLLLLPVCLHAQVPEPNLLWLKGYGGNAWDNFESHVNATSDGGFVLSLSSNSNVSTGNIDSFCNIGGNRVVFLKYNYNASILEWSRCFLVNGDTDILYMFPTNDGGAVLGGVYNAAWGYYICKQDIAGNILWSRAYSTSIGVMLYSLYTMAVLWMLI